MFIDAYNEVVKCIRARVSAINLVVDAERFLDQMLPNALSNVGAKLATYEQMAGTEKIEAGPAVAVMDSNVLSGLSLRQDCVAALSRAGVVDIVNDFVRSCTDIRDGVSRNKLPDSAIVANLQELDNRLSKSGTGVFAVLILRDADVVNDKKLCRSLLRHCAAEVGVTVAVVSSEPLNVPALRACMPVVKVGHPSVAELAKTVLSRLNIVSKVVGSGNIYVVNGDVASPANIDTLASLCGAALAGLPVSQAMNLLSMQLESGVKTVGDTKTVTISVSELANAKAEILNKEGYMTLIRDLPDESRIGGLDVLKRWVRLRSKGFTKAAKDARLASPKGLMLVGPPGTAKSMSAKVIASVFNVPLIRLDMGALFNSLLGSSERNLRNALAVADASAPCVVLVDEADKALAGMTTGQSDSGVSTRLMGTLLTWLADKTTDVFVVMTANSIHGLPPELTRKGRLDGVVFVNLPNAMERRAIWKIHLDLVDQSLGSADIDKLGDISDGYSGAEIEAIVQDALYEGFDGISVKLDVAMLSAAVKNTVPLSKARAADIRDLRDWAAQNAISASLTDPSQETETTTIGFNL